MLFSIITVCFNSAKTIRQTFDSVLQQEFTDYEYIVVDGASTDGTVDIIKEYEPKFQGRMRWISEPDTGIYNAMNKGARMAQGKYLAYINSNDFYEQDAFVKIAEEIRNNSSCNVFYGFVRYLDDMDCEKYSIRYHHSDLGNRCLVHPGVFMERALFLAQNGFDESFKISADYDLFVRIFLNKSAIFFPVDLVIANFRMTGVSCCNINDGLLETAKLKYKNKLISKAEYQKRANMLLLKKHESYKMYVFICNKLKTTIISYLHGK